MEFETAEAAIASIDPNESVDLIVWSLGSRSMTSLDCQQELENLKAKFPRSPIALLAACDDPSEVAKAMHLGARGYVPTSYDHEQVWEILRFVRAGGTYVPVSVLDDPEHHETAPTPPKAMRAKSLEKLTPRELAVAEKLRQGKPNKIIAHELQISESTVKVFVHRILTKLDAINRTEVAYLFQE